MERIREGLALSSLPKPWCQSTLDNDFCSYDWPDSWSFSSDLLGLERPLLSALKHCRDIPVEEVRRGDVTKLQCVLHLVLESGVRGEGAALPGLLASTLYLRLCEAFPQRQVFHEVIYTKVMELLKSVEGEEAGVGRLHTALTSFLSAQPSITLSDRCSWLTVKATLASLCNHPSLPTRPLDLLTTTKKQLRFFVKESLKYLQSGKSPLADACCELLCTRDCPRTTLLLLQHLLISISERTGPRRETEEYVLQLVKSLDPESGEGLREWLVGEYAISKKVVHRLFAVEMCFQLSHTAEEKTPLLQVIVDALSDKAPTVRAKALIVLGDLLKSNSEEVLAVLDPSLPLLPYLCRDDKSGVRKASAQVLESLLVHAKVTTKWINLLYQLCLDEAISVRKQGLTGVSRVLGAHPENKEVSRLWLEAILPSVTDVEKGVQEMGVKTVRTVIEEPEENWRLLELIADPCSSDMQVYLGIALKDCDLQKSSRDFITSRLPEPTALMLVSMAPDQFALKIGELMKLLADCPESDSGYQQMCLIVKCLREMEPRDSSVFMVMVQKFSLPHAVTKELLQLIRFIESDPGDCYRDLLTIISTTLQETCLSEENTQQDPLSSRRLSSYLFTLGEISLFIEVPENIVLAVKELLVSTDTFSNLVRAHAVLALGKISLVNESVAKDAVLLLSRLLGLDENPEIRNNCMVTLGDLVVRYPTLVTDYTHCLTDTLGDESVVVRRQSLILHTKLLQEDYLKWKSGTVFKFLSNLVHENIEIRKLCELCLSNIILVRYPNTFYDFLVEAVFFSNGLIELLQASEPNLRKFCSPGDEPRKRRSIYRVMLQKFDDQQKLQISGRVCKEILGMFVGDESPIPDTHKPLLQDALWILRSPLLKLKSLKARANNDFDEDDEHVEAIQAQTKVISVIVKRNFVENCFPVITALRSKLKELKSPLQRELSQFLASFLSDYKSEIAEVCQSADEQLLSEVQYDIAEMDREGEDEERDRSMITPGKAMAFIAPSTILHSPFFSVPTPKESRVGKQSIQGQSLVKKLFKTPARSDNLRRLISDAAKTKERSQPLPTLPDVSGEVEVPKFQRTEGSPTQLEPDHLMEQAESLVRKTAGLDLDAKSNRKAPGGAEENELSGKDEATLVEEDKTKTKEEDAGKIAANDGKVPAPDADIVTDFAPIVIKAVRTGKALFNPDTSAKIGDLSISPEKEKRKPLVVGKMMTTILPVPPESIDELVQKRMERLQKEKENRANRSKRKDRRAVNARGELEADTSGSRAQDEIEVCQTSALRRSNAKPEPKPSSCDRVGEVGGTKIISNDEEAKNVDTVDATTKSKKAKFLLKMLRSKKGNPVSSSAALVKPPGEDILEVKSAEKYEASLKEADIPAGTSKVSEPLDKPSDASKETEVDQRSDASKGTDADKPSIASKETEADKRSDASKEIDSDKPSIASKEIEADMRSDASKETDPDKPPFVSEDKVRDDLVAKSKETRSEEVHSKPISTRSNNLRRLVLEAAKRAKAKEKASDVPKVVAKSKENIPESEPFSSTVSTTENPPTTKEKSVCTNPGSSEKSEIFTKPSVPDCSEGVATSSQAKPKPMMRGRVKLNFGKLKRREDILLSTQTDQVIRKRQTAEGGGYEILTETPASKRRSTERPVQIGSVTQDLTFQPEVASTPLPAKAGSSGMGAVVASTPAVWDKVHKKPFNCDVSSINDKI